ncbi:FlgD immunoglobulin-like domain containing protein [Paraconexibacter algicola]|uniref:FlgD/Vpr Ig-like domain-containing protein n=1 Tax=Paraconexibacter algicola TaxID=2133960 RepID=A0A2T4UKP6_9ACTN|nr:FlgD immunoglobulin-like domain containing protein [Paraconexibacter algicola]PTL59819.1 hypothetical protein C7Y72_09235 [Paraconexibacter algicola]
MLRPRRLPVPVLAALGVLAPGAAAAEAPVVFTNTGTDCRNLAITLPIDPVAARELVPERFAFAGEEPEGFVELATCPEGTIDGVRRPAYRIAEAAVVIRTPVPLDDPGGTITQDIYAISQLDTDPELSRRKVDVGFRSDLVDIAFDRSGPLGTRIDARIPWAFSPYTMTADLTPGTPPLPGVTIVTRIWGLGPKGLVLTRNDIEQVHEGSVASGTVTFAPGSPLSRLFGGTTLRGTGISGRGTFTNVTRIVEPAPVASPAPAPAVRPRLVVRREGRALRIAVRDAAGPFRATVRRGASARGGLVRTLRGATAVRWDGRRADGRRVPDGRYTVRVRRTTGDRALVGALTVRVARGAVRPTG